MERRHSTAEVTEHVPLHDLLQRVFGVPLLALPRAAMAVRDVLLRAVIARAGTLSGAENGAQHVQIFGAIERPDGSAHVFSPRSSRFVGEYRIGEDGWPFPYPTTADGIAIISILGNLVNRGAWLETSCGMVSYEGLRHQLQTVRDDADVKGVILDVNSPGGEAMGMGEIAALVREVAAKKPVALVINAMACSAAYGIGSGATRIFIVPDGIGGSIGVFCMHVSFAEVLKNEGIKVTLIHEGAHKVDGNPYEDLPDEVRADIQAEVKQFYGMFVKTVAQGRGDRLPEAKVRATEARVYIGQAAVDAGLADQVGTFDDALAWLRKPEQTAGAVQPEASRRAALSAPLAKPASREVSAALATLFAEM